MAPSLLPLETPGITRLSHRGCDMPKRRRIQNAACPGRCVAGSSAQVDVCDRQPGSLEEAPSCARMLMKALCGALLRSELQTDSQFVKFRSEFV